MGVNMLDDLRMGEIASKSLPDGRRASIHLLTYGRARLVVGDAVSPFYDDGW